MSKGRILSRSFYLREDVVALARQLLGKVIVHETDDGRSAGIITETEAYAGVVDKASHAYAGKRTARNAPMYAQGGTAYVYLCYGIHHLFNVVTNGEGVPHAVLVRGVVPVEGIPLMKERRGSAKLTTAGPGTLTTALGIRTHHSGGDLLSGPITIEDRGLVFNRNEVLIGPRIGVDYAGDDALLPYRFRVAPSRLASLAGE
ncbi:MAG TPA: DNA-3-methyladenine glycosylase [Flavobacteriales bacterium]|nr:DNA-3-methyladenine glycosylase [Flavobacteriales bacterium]